MVLISLWILALFAVAVVAVPNSCPSDEDGKYRSKGGTSLCFNDGEDLPYLLLSYGKYQAASYDADLDVYRFRNIRFGADAGGQNRWKTPQEPEYDVPDKSFPKISCRQVPMVTFKKSPIWREPKPTIPEPQEREDCLFLDMQIPAKVLDDPETHSLPVVVFFFGGAYVFGSKDETPNIMYDGARLIRQSENDLIWISPNYRLGAMGWLAGTTMEQEGTPNAGLYDQRAALEWVQKHISSIGGNRSQVTAIGQSAGASSLLHHLVLKGGTLDPLFNQVVLLSPAFIPLYDRTGDLDQLFQKFSKEATKGIEEDGCKGLSQIECLRTLDEGVIVAANKKIISERQKGSFILGPSADGDLVRQLPALEFASGTTSKYIIVVTESAKTFLGHYWSKIDSIIISHTSDEGSMFAVDDISSNLLFNTFLYELFPNYTSTLVDEMIDYYPIEDYWGSDTPQKERLATFIRDAVITCNVRWVASAYNEKGGPGGQDYPGSYVMNWDTAPTIHGGDLLAHFLPLKFGPITIDSFFARVYRDYFISFYKTGDPNAWKRPGALRPRAVWDKVADAGFTDHDMQLMSKVQHAYHGNLLDWSFEPELDFHVPRHTCDFWLHIQSAMMSKRGYVPPGAEVPSVFDPHPQDPSGNYTTPESDRRDSKKFNAFVVQEL